MDLPSFEIGTIHLKVEGFHYQNNTKICNSSETSNTALIHMLVWLYPGGKD
jgi:hypothetical protein